jgi:hypothetical protein
LPKYHRDLATSIGYAVAKFIKAFDRFLGNRSTMDQKGRSSPRSCTVVGGTRLVPGLGAVEGWKKATEPCGGPDARRLYVTPVLADHCGKDANISALEERKCFFGP